MNKISNITYIFIGLNTGFLYIIKKNFAYDTLYFAVLNINMYTTFCYLPARPLTRTRGFPEYGSYECGFANDNYVQSVVVLADDASGSYSGRCPSSWVIFFLAYSTI